MEEELDIFKQFIWEMEHKTMCMTYEHRFARELKNVYQYLIAQHQSNENILLALKRVAFFRFGGNGLIDNETLAVLNADEIYCLAQKP